MNRSYSGPQLVTLEGEFGENENIAELLGIDYDDVNILTQPSGISPRQMMYLNNKYPEYMGFWATLISAVGTAVGKGVQAISKAVNTKKKREADKKAADREAAEKKAAAEKVIADKKASDKKLMLMIGIPVAGLAALMLLKK